MADDDACFLARVDGSEGMKGKSSGMWGCCYVPRASLK
jgi:hypothetical protein